MKFIKWTAFLFCSILFGLCAVNAVAETEYQVFELGNFRYKVPADWITIDADSGTARYHYAKEKGSHAGGYIYTSLYDLKIYSPLAETQFQGFINGMFSSDDVKVRMLSLDDFPVGRAQGTIDVNGEENPVCTALYTNGETLLSIMYSNSEMTFDEMESALDEICEHIIIQTDNESSNSIYDFNDFTIEISSTPVYSVSGNDYLVCNFKWTNTTDVNKIFASQVCVKAFQNGVSLEAGEVSGIDTKSFREVMPGYSLDVASIFKLDDMSEVLVIVTPQDSSMNQAKLDFSISLTQQ